jgi:uncharacterized protein (TIGR02284 family)
MQNENTMKVLNTLISINDERIEGYETALKETKEYDLKPIFKQFISTSQTCKSELVLEVSKLGGAESKSTKISGKFFRVWMDIKATLVGNERRALLNSCEFGEDEAQDDYNEVLETASRYLSTQQQTMIINQKCLLKSDYIHIRILSNASIYV